MNALKAKEFYRRDVQYIVRNGKALIINEVFMQYFFYVSVSLLQYHFLLLFDSCDILLMHYSTMDIITGKEFPANCLASLCQHQLAGERQTILCFSPNMMIISIDNGYKSQNCLDAIASRMQFVIFKVELFINSFQLNYIVLIVTDGYKNLKSQTPYLCIYHKYYQVQV